MKGFLLASILFISSVVAFVLPLPVTAEGAGATKVEASVDVLKELSSVPEKGIPPALFRHASGIAIIPGVIKAGFVVGGRYGTGVLVVRDKEGHWSAPSFISIAGGSVGWQIGVESIDIILVFKHEKSINRILSGKFTLGADASIAAGPVGREAQAATDVQLKSEIYAYSKSRGLFAGLALSGAVLQIDDKDNEAFYGKKGIVARDIFSGEHIKTPDVAEKLRRALAEVAGK